MVQILERVDAHYESREMPFGKVYAWHPALVALECDCGEKVTLSAPSSSTKTTCSGCGAELGTFVNEIREREGRLPDNLTHPWFYDARQRAQHTSMMRPLIPKARAGVTTILRQQPTRSKPKEK